VNHFQKLREWKSIIRFERQQSKVGIRKLHTEPHIMYLQGLASSLSVCFGSPIGWDRALSRAKVEEFDAGGGVNHFQKLREWKSMIR